MPITVIGSFRKRLCVPRIPQIQGNYRQLPPPPDSTKATPAPRVTRPEEDPDALLAIGFQQLTQIQNIIQLSYHMPQDEGHHCLITEADVSDLSRLQLLHSVNVAVRVVLRNRSGWLECRREQWLDTHSRPDVTWVYMDSTGKETNIAFLEFKNTYVLRKEDFNPANAETPRIARQKLQDLDARHAETLLEGNAEIVSKQIKKYWLASDKSVPDIAVFDWKNMAVFDFSNNSEVADGNVWPVALTWFSEDEKNNNDIVKGYTFRTCLFGFLVRALKRHGLI